MFSSFSVKDFRIYWIGMFVSFCGSWIQTIAQSWLVFELSKSAFLLGLVGFISNFPIFLLSIFSGVLVDRINKKYLLLATQAAFMVLAFALAILTQFNIITINLIIIISVLNGIVFTLDAPARQSIVVELVGKQNLMNGIALNSIAFHSARMIGPALAGILIAAVSTSGCFYINAISFLAFIVALLVIKPNHVPRDKNINFFEDLKSGVNFIKQNRVFLILITITGTISLFGYSYMVLMPVFAKMILGQGAKGYGILMSATGIGSLLGGLFIASLKSPKTQPRVLIVSLFTFSFCLILFSLSKLLITSCVILVVIGFSSLCCLAIINTIVQTIVPDKFRGRIMSIYVITFAGTIPFGSLIAGAVSQSIGVDKAIFLSGIICLSLFLVFYKKILFNQELFTV